MPARDPDEQHRTSTPLELLFDLCFVVAVSQAAAQLARGLEEGHLGTLGGYAMVFFAIWWAWMNVTWFASAYDTDDVPYRLLTLVQMAGVLILAAGVPAALNGDDYSVVTIGYAVMRVPGIAQWLRATHDHPEGRRTAVRYAADIAVVQALWIARLVLPGSWIVATYVVFVFVFAVQAAQPHAHLADVDTGLAVAAPVTVFLLVISRLRRLTWPVGSHRPIAALGMAAAVLVCGLLVGVLEVGTAVVAMGLVLGVALTPFLRLSRRQPAGSG